MFLGHQKSKDANASLFVPIISSKKLPSSARKFFRFGIPESIETEEKNSFCQKETKEDLNL